MTRNMRRKTEATHMSSGAGGGQSIGGIGDGVNSDAGGYGAYANAAEEYYEKNTKIKHINMVYFSKYRLTTWYFSPYPDDYGSSVCACARVFVCACVRACVRACVCVCVGIAPPLAVGYCFTSALSAAFVVLCRQTTCVVCVRVLLQIHGPPRCIPLT